MALEHRRDTGVDGRLRRRVDRHAVVVVPGAPGGHHDGRPLGPEPFGDGTTDVALPSDDERDTFRELQVHTGHATRGPPGRCPRDPATTAARSGHSRTAPQRGAPTIGRTERSSDEADRAPPIRRRHDRPTAAPGSDQELDPTADHGERSYRGSGKLTGKRAVITGGDSGIGKAVAIAFAREGADVLISYLPDEEDDAQDTKRWIEEAGRTAVLLPGDVSDPAYCRSVVATAVERLGGLDVLVNNAAYQMTHETIEEISDEEWDHTLATNLSAYFHLVKAALPHLGPGRRSSGRAR